MKKNEYQSFWRQWMLLVAFMTVNGCGNSDADGPGGGGSAVTLLNVSYDPTREFYSSVTGTI